MIFILSFSQELCSRVEEVYSDKGANHDNSSRATYYEREGRRVAVRESYFISSTL